MHRLGVVLGGFKLKGLSSAIAVAIIAVNPSGYDYFLTAGVHDVGGAAVDASADHQLSALDEVIDTWAFEVAANEAISASTAPVTTDLPLIPGGERSRGTHLRRALAS